MTLLREILFFSFLDPYFIFGLMHFEGPRRFFDPAANALLGPPPYARDPIWQGHVLKVLASRS
jgi:hypothetical protein